MKAKISRGAYFRGAVNYVLDTGAKATGQKAPELICTNLTGETPEEFAEEFEVARECRAEVPRPVLHISLSLPESDGSLASEKWEEIAREFMKRYDAAMGSESGYDQGFAPHLVVRHNDHKEHDHIHIIMSRVDFAGRLQRDNHNNIPIAIRITQELEREYGLTATKPYDKVEKPRLTETEKRLAERTQREPIRERIRAAVDSVLADRPTATAFVERLEAQGIQVRPNIATTGRLNGFSFEVDGVAFKGSQLGDEYKIAGLVANGLSYEPGRDAEFLHTRKASGSDAKEGRTDEAKVAEDLAYDMAARRKALSWDLRKEIDAVLKEKPTALAFVEALEERGVRVLPNVASTGRMNGFAFEIEGERFKASELGKEYAFAKMEARGLDYDADRDGGALRAMREGVHLPEASGEQILENVRRVTALAISEDTILEAERVGFAMHTGRGLAFVGRGEDGTARSAMFFPRLQESRVEGADRSVPPIFPGEGDTVLIAETGIEALAMRELALRRDGIAPTIVVGSRWNDDWMDNPRVQEVLRETMAVGVGQSVPGDEERRREAQERSQRMIEKLMERVPEAMVYRTTADDAPTFVKQNQIDQALVAFDPASAREAMVFRADLAQRYSAKTLAEAELAGFIVYSKDGAAFAGRDAQGIMRSAETVGAQQHEYVPGIAPIWMGDPSRVWLVRTGEDALALADMAQRRGEAMPTIIVTNGRRDIADNPVVASLVANAAQVETVTGRALRDQNAEERRAGELGAPGVAQLRSLIPSQRAEQELSAQQKRLLRAQGELSREALADLRRKMQSHAHPSIP